MMTTRFEGEAWDEYRRTYFGATGDDPDPDERCQHGMFVHGIEDCERCGIDEENAEEIEMMDDTNVEQRVGWCSICYAEMVPVGLFRRYDGALTTPMCRACYETKFNPDPDHETATAV